MTRRGQEGASKDKSPRGTAFTKGLFITYDDAIRPATLAISTVLVIYALHSALASTVNRLAAGSTALAVITFLPKDASFTPSPTVPMPPSPFSSTLTTPHVVTAVGTFSASSAISSAPISPQESPPESFRNAWFRGSGVSSD